jgi:hypothetical protein
MPPILDWNLRWKWTILYYEEIDNIEIGWMIEKDGTGK